MSGVASKAQRAAALCPILLQASGVETKRVYAEELDKLFPDIRCRVDSEGQLCVYYLAWRMRKSPRSLFFAASWIEAVNTDGSSTIIKDMLGNEQGQRRSRAGIELEAFEVSFPPPPPGRSMWDRLLDEPRF